eukprot:CAMPEP_0182856918 /NCGR_PEP_ID=MMETSP0034_2-20130328/2740_1 /TAXON_ID=156128 /ORGANISM="Nephroselmis pyriformis, Strain CCMP717" /LENGTH=110 /DNA_ID=CAMNT_0024988089 /DNA_START=166 /DNA_END=495 /DNA_ORIENTATION=+
MAVSAAIHEQCSQPSFTVEKLGMLPGETPECVWVCDAGEGARVPMESFWAPALGPVQQLFPDVGPGGEGPLSYEAFVRNMFFKCERANLDGRAVLALGVRPETPPTCTRV